MNSEGYKAQSGSVTGERPGAHFRRSYHLVWSATAAANLADGGDARGRSVAGGVDHARPASGVGTGRDPVTSFALLRVPSSAGAYGVGQQRAPAALEAAGLTLAGLCAAERLAAITVTEVNPDHDPDGDQLRRLARGLADAIGKATTRRSR